MKKFLVYIFSIMPILSFAQNYFKDGMTWQVRVSNTDIPNITKYETYSLDGSELVDGYEAMKMYITDDYESKSHEFVMYIRTSGDKVYFKTLDLQEWLLMYDFGLKPEESSYVYDASYAIHNKKKLRTYVKCTGLKENESNGLTEMSLQEYSDESCSFTYGKGTWLKGLSSENGVVYNNRFELDGIGLMLMEASYKGDVVYQKTLAGIDATQENNVSVYSDGLDIVVDNVESPCLVMVYSATGKLVKKQVVNSRLTKFTMPCPGIYLVQIDGTTTKVNCLGC